MRRLTLSTETLRVLDDEALTQVVGGNFTGASGQCNKSGKASNPGSGNKWGCKKKKHEKKEHEKKHRPSGSISVA